MTDQQRLVLVVRQRIVQHLQQCERLRLLELYGPVTYTLCIRELTPCTLTIVNQYIYNLLYPSSIILINS